MRRESILNSDPNTLFKKLESQSASRVYRNRQNIFYQGDAATAMFRVELGYVKLAVASTRSNKAAVSILREGDCFGEGCIGTPLRTCTATSIGQSIIGKISKRALARRLQMEPAFAKLFTAYLLLRIRRVEDDLMDQLMNTSERRLARLLLKLSGFSKRSGRAPEVANIDQETLAQAVGTTRSRVSHFMNEFRQKGFIDYNGHLQVHKSLLSYLLKE
ncbi:MAG: Crp/Fnr family transcriptional regulator [Acidobacteriales bacterium]|nr:Crp/Fnr family transcriptional regulator [Terriglobales bacterium]